MREFTTETQAQFLAEENKPIEIMALYLDDGPIYLAKYDTNVNFYDMRVGHEDEEVTYYSFAWSRDNIKTNQSFKSDMVNISVVNVNRLISQYMEYTEFRGRRIILGTIFKRDRDASDYPYGSSGFDAMVRFDGEISQPVADENTVSIECTSKIGNFDLAVPKRNFSILCQYIFGSKWCGVDLDDVTFTGLRAMDGSTTSLIRTTDKLGQYDLFNNGELWFTACHEDNSLNEMERRMIIKAAYNGGYSEYTLNWTLPLVPHIGVDADIFTAQQRCNKSYESCLLFGSLGSDLGKNFGGFPTIPNELVIRRY